MRIRLANALRRLFTGPARQVPGPVDEIDSLLAELIGTEATRVAILSDAGASDLGTLIAARHPRAEVLDLARSIDPWERHLQLLARSPYDLAIIDTEADEARFSLLQDVLFLVRSHGHVVVHRCGTGPAGGFALDLATVTAAQRREVKPSKKVDSTRQGDLIRVGRGLDSLHWRGDHLVLTRATNLALAKLDEPAMNKLLERDPGYGRLIAALPGESFPSRATLSYNADARPSNMRPVFETPEISLRSYHDVIVGKGQVAVTDRVVLPDAYRHNGQRRLVNRYLVDLAPRFARPKFDTSELGILEGTFFYLDSEFRGHFGHLLTEQASRMWAWPRVKQEHPEAKVLMATATLRPEIQEFEYLFLEAAGVARDDIVLIKEPVRVTRLLGATPMLSMPYYIHPRMGEIWGGIGDALAAQAGEVERHPRIFCSRTITKRACNNRAEVEELFAKNGFEIVFPETLALPDQVQLFRSAQVIAGFAGSGLFNVALVDGPKRVISVGSTRYTATNEYMMASVLGHELSMITCLPDDPAKYQSNFTFDPEREGPFLQELFDSLG